MVKSGPVFCSLASRFDTSRFDTNRSRFDTNEKSFRYKSKVVSIQMKSRFHTNEKSFRYKSKISRNLMSSLVRIIHACVIVFSTNAKGV